MFSEEQNSEQEWNWVYRVPGCIAVESHNIWTRLGGRIGAESRLEQGELDEVNPNPASFVAPVSQRAWNDAPYQP